MTATMELEQEQALDERTPRLAWEVRRIVEAAHAALTRREKMLKPDHRSMWRIELETDDSFMLRQTLTVSAGPGYGAELTSFDCLGAPRRYYVDLPKRDGGDGVLASLTGEELAHTVQAINNIWETGREFGIIGD